MVMPHYSTLIHPITALYSNEILDALENRSPLVEGAEPGLAYVGLYGMQGLYPDDNVLVNAVKEAIPEEFAAPDRNRGEQVLAYLGRCIALRTILEYCPVTL